MARAKFEQMALEIAQLWRDVRSASFATPAACAPAAPSPTSCTRRYFCLLHLCVTGDVLHGDLTACQQPLPLSRWQKKLRP